MKCALISYWKDITGLKEELKAYDKVFAVERAAYELLKQGIVIEKVIGDFDTIEQATFSKFDVEIEVLPSEKDETDTTTMFNYINQTYPTCAITIYNEFADRIDHALVLLSLFEKRSDLKIITPKTEIQCFVAGWYKIEVKKSYHYISFIALTEVSNITLKNFKYPLKHSRLMPFSDLTISNEFINTDGGTLFFEKGKVLVIYSRD